MSIINTSDGGNEGPIDPLGVFRELSPLKSGTSRKSPTESEMLEIGLKAWKGCDKDQPEQVDKKQKLEAAITVAVQRGRVKLLSRTSHSNIVQNLWYQQFGGGNELEAQISHAAQEILEDARNDALTLKNADPEKTYKAVERLLNAILRYPVNAFSYKALATAEALIGEFQMGQEGRHTLILCAALMRTSAHNSRSVSNEILQKFLTAFKKETETGTSSPQELAAWAGQFVESTPDFSSDKTPSFMDELVPIPSAEMLRLYQGMSTIKPLDFIAFAKVFKEYAVKVTVRGNVPEHVMVLWKNIVAWVDQLATGKLDAAVSQGQINLADLLNVYEKFASSTSLTLEQQAFGAPLQEKLSTIAAAIANPGSLDRLTQSPATLASLAFKLIEARNTTSAKQLLLHLPLAMERPVEKLDLAGHLGIFFKIEGMEVVLKLLDIDVTLLMKETFEACFTAAQASLMLKTGDLNFYSAERLFQQMEAIVANGVHEEGQVALELADRLSKWILQKYGPVDLLKVLEKSNLPKKFLDLQKKNVGEKTISMADELVYTANQGRFDYAIKKRFEQILAVQRKLGTCYPQLSKAIDAYLNTGLLGPAEILISRVYRIGVGEQVDRLKNTLKKRESGLQSAFKTMSNEAVTNYFQNQLETNPSFISLRSSKQTELKEGEYYFTRAEYFSSGHILVYCVGGQNQTIQIQSQMFSRGWQVDGVNLAAITVDELLEELIKMYQLPLTHSVYQGRKIAWTERMDSFYTGNKDPRDALAGNKNTYLVALNITGNNISKDRYNLFYTNDAGTVLELNIGITKEGRFSVTTQNTGKTVIGSTIKNLIDALNSEDGSIPSFDTLSLYAPTKQLKTLRHHIGLIRDVDAILKLPNMAPGAYGIIANKDDGDPYTFACALPEQKIYSVPLSVSEEGYITCEVSGNGQSAPPQKLVAATLEELAEKIRATLPSKGELRMRPAGSGVEGLQKIVRRHLAQNAVVKPKQVEAFFKAQQKTLENMNDDIMAKIVKKLCQYINEMALNPSHYKQQSIWIADLLDFDDSGISTALNAILQLIDDGKSRAVKILIPQRVIGYGENNIIRLSGCFTITLRLSKCVRETIYDNKVLRIGKDNSIDTSTHNVLHRNIFDALKGTDAKLAVPPEQLICGSGRDRKVMGEQEFYYGDLLMAIQTREIPLDFTQNSKMRRVTWQEMLAIFIDVSRTLQVMHENGFCHCDLKPDNILIGINKSGVLEGRVADLDLANEMWTVNEKPQGTPEYKDETARIGCVSPAIDHYAFAISLQDLLRSWHTDLLAQADVDPDLMNRTSAQHEINELSERLITESKVLAKRLDEESLLLKYLSSKDSTKKLMARNEIECLITSSAKITEQLVKIQTKYGKP